MKKGFVIGLIVGMLAMGVVLQAEQRPVRNVSKLAHPNLAAAQDLITLAWDKLAAAQQANEFDLGGHAQNAKLLLVQANDEIKQAAIKSNRNQQK